MQTEEAEESGGEDGKEGERLEQREVEHAGHDTLECGDERLVALGLLVARHHRHADHAAHVRLHVSA